MRFALKLPPLSLIPLVIYNLIALDMVGDQGLGWGETFFTLSMKSGGVWTLSIGDAILLLALFMLFFELLKATRRNGTALLDHIFSAVVFGAYLLQFIFVSAASTSLFFICMTIALIDVIAGYAISASNGTTKFIDE